MEAEVIEPYFHNASLLIVLYTLTIDQVVSGFTFTCRLTYLKFYYYENC